MTQARQTMLKTMILVGCISLLSACGGSGSGGNTTVTPEDNTSNGSDQNNDVSQDQTSQFMVSVQSLSIKRLSNDENVEVDTSELASGQLQYVRY